MDAITTIGSTLVTGIANEIKSQIFDNSNVKINVFGENGIIPIKKQTKEIWLGTLCIKIHIN